MENESKKAYMKEYHERNKEKLKAKSKAYLQKPEIKTRYIARSREYYQKNKDKINAKSKAYRQKNKEKLNAYAKEYREKNKGKLLHRMREYGKEYHAKNKEIVNAHHREYFHKNKDKIHAHRKERYDKMKQDFFLTYKNGKCCSTCGYNEHPEILQFHHTEKKDKDFTIGNLKMHEKISPELKAEIDKCILLCPNCHFLLHFKREKKEIAE